MDCPVCDRPTTVAELQAYRGRCEECWADSRMWNTAATAPRVECLSEVTNQPVTGPDHTPEEDE